MNVKGIFITLITIVACVLIGALFLNTLLPNVAAQVVNAVEGTIYQATGMSFDFNGDGIKGSSSGTDSNYDDSNNIINDENIGGGNVDGFQ